MKNVLFLTSGLFYDPTVYITNRQFQILSSELRGHILGVVYEDYHKNVTLSNFQVHGIRAPKFAQGYGAIGGIYRLAMYCLFVIFKTLHIHYIQRDKLDAVIACDAFKTGVLALIIRRLTGAKVGLDIVGNYVKAFEVNSPNPTGLSWVKQKFTLWVAPKIINRANGVKLLYEAQLEGLHGIRPDLEVACFHDIVPLEKFSPKSQTPPYILIAGHPWFLKGVDLLLTAFGRLHSRFPTYRLKVVGYCLEPDAFFDMAEGFKDKVDFFPNGVPYSEMTELICGCEIFVLASRTEAMGRVLLEAMSAAKPVIGSRIDGIPRIVKDEETGLLFECGNADDLYEKLLRLMAHPEIAQKMGHAGALHVREYFSEALYGKYFTEFVQKIATAKSA